MKTNPMCLVPGDAHGSVVSPSRPRNLRAVLAATALLAFGMGTAMPQAAGVPPAGSERTRETGLNEVQAPSEKAAAVTALERRSVMATSLERSSADPAPPSPAPPPGSPAPAPAPPNPPPPSPQPAPAPAPVPLPTPPGPPPGSTPTPEPAPGTPPAPVPAPGEPEGGTPAAPGSQPTQTPPIPPRPALPPSLTGPGGADVQAGLTALARGDLNEARSRFEKALTLDPDNQIAHSRFAYLIFRKGDFVRAAKEAQIAVRLDPTDALSWVILGRSHEAVGDKAKAESAYAAAAETLPHAKTAERLVSVALAHYLRAMLHILRGDPAGVEADLKETLRIYPKNAYAHYEYALQLLKAGRFAEAADAFKLASDARATFQPQETWVYPARRYLFIEENLHYWRGVALREAGRIDEAIAEFETVIPKAESLAGSTMTQQVSTASTQLEGRVETSFYSVNYAAAVAHAAKGDKAKALSLIKALLRVNMADADTLKRAKDLQKQLH